MIARLACDLFVILTAGWISGVVSKRLGVSMLVGYLLAGAVIGRGGIGLIAEDARDIEYIARAGALLLLFAIGIEFSLEELVRLGRYFFVGGSVQMVLVAAPVGLGCTLIGLPWQSALLIGAATALSSTVLVFRALTEWGETASPAGRRAIGVLLFQDVALVPLMLLVPLLTGTGEGSQVRAGVLLALNALWFVVGVATLRSVFRRYLVPLLSHLKSVELVVLFALIVLVGFCLGAHAVGLPPALGAFAAGLVLNGNRLTKQIDALILPYRESFGAVFFVSLGTLLDLSVFWHAPWVLTVGLLAVLVVKTGGATVALRVTGLPWRAAAGMGLGLAQLGELSFVLLSESLHADLISQLDYDRMLFVAIGSLIVTPELLKLGLRSTRQLQLPEEEATGFRRPLPRAPQQAIVVGLGPIGRHAASQLEIAGVDVCLIDLSPVNLHSYAQQGFRTVAGDARDPEVLDHAEAVHVHLAVVAVPEDRIALQILKTLRKLNPTCTVMVRSRYHANMVVFKKAGADAVVSEEAEASTALSRQLEQALGSRPTGGSRSGNPTQENANHEPDSP